MKDQVAQLRKKGISALAIYTGMPFQELSKTLELAMHGQIKFLYVSPERIQTRLFKEYLPALPLNLIAVDEAHCVSQWGYDFRPQYLQIASLREALPKVPILALTASATPLVQEDILKQLQLRAAIVLKGSFSRANLSYSCFDEANKFAKLTSILAGVEGSSIVYCRSRKRTVDVCRHLQQQGLTATFYHAGLNQEERNERQQNWTNNQVRIVVSTNAFGMGIDKPDVRTVIHMDIPDCLENYYQEAGRAGRDTAKAFAVLLYQEQDFTELALQLEKKFPSEQTVKKVYESLVHFLQIPIGVSEGNSYDFDLSLFCQQFDIDRSTAIHSLQLLQANGYCSLNESVFEPGRAQFIASRDWVETVERNYPSLEPLIKALLRNIEGVFSYPGIVSLLYMARLLKQEKTLIEQQLKQLVQLGVISYDPPKDQPQLVLLTERLKPSNILLNQKDIDTRKNLAKKRLDAMKTFVTGQACRAAYIGRYFGDDKITDCGICDNCLNAKKMHRSLASSSQQIMQMLQQGATSITAMKQLPEWENEHQQLLRTIRHLESEGWLQVDFEGNITVL